MFRASDIARRQFFKTFKAQGSLGFFHLPSPRTDRDSASAHASRLDEPRFQKLIGTTALGFMEACQNSWPLTILASEAPEQCVGEELS